jgi:hypothetical protein
LKKREFGMPQKCRVCNHPQRAEIETLILAEEQGKGRIASLFGISEKSVRNHSAKCMGLEPRKRTREMEVVAQRREVGAVSAMETKVNALIAEAESIGREARDSAEMKMEDRLKIALSANERQEQLIKTVGNLALRKEELDSKNTPIQVEVEYI